MRVDRAIPQIPAAYRPTPRQREHRHYVRHRQFLQRKITGVRNKICRLLSNHNLDRPDLFTEEGQKFLQSLSLPAADRFCIEQLLAQWKGYRMQLKQVDEQLQSFANSGSKQEKADRAILRTIPGVGVVTSDVILAELADWRRFSSLKKVIAYAGFAPGLCYSVLKSQTAYAEQTLQAAVAETNPTSLSLPGIPVMN